MAGIECFHMMSRQPYWCPKTMKRRPCRCPKPVLWELNSFLMQTISFVPINLHRFWPREWKHSIQYSGTRPQIFEHCATKNGGSIFYLAFAFVICNYCICIVPVHTCEMENAQTRPECPLCLHWQWGSSHVNFLLLVLVIVFLFFTLASIVSTSPRTPNSQTFLMNINVGHTDKLHTTMQHTEYITITKKFFLI